MVACADRDCKVSKPAPVKCSCDRYDCPTCYHNAVERMAVQSAERLEQFPKDFWEEYRLRAGQLKHFVISCNPTMWRRERVLADGGRSFEKAARKVLDWAAQDGFYACEAMLHLEREKHKDGSDCIGKDCDRPTSEHVWVWGPHYHCVGYGFFKGNDMVQWKFGKSWTLSVIPEGEGKDRSGYATLMYQGSHASIIYREKDHKQAVKLVKHWGRISPRIYARKLVKVDYEAKKCDCGQPLKVFLPGEDLMPDRMNDLGPHVVKVQHHGFSFKQRNMTEWLRGREARRIVDLKERAGYDLERFKSLTPKGSEREPDPTGGYPHARCPGEALGTTIGGQ